MKLTTPNDLHPDLVIDREAAFDRMGTTAAASADKQKPYFDKQIQLIRRLARAMCSEYKNCRREDWCFHCSSGQYGQLFRGDVCLGCKLLTSDALVQIKARAHIELNQETMDQIT